MPRSLPFSDCSHQKKTIYIVEPLAINIKSSAVCFDSGDIVSSTTIRNKTRSATSITYACTPLRFFNIAIKPPHHQFLYYFALSFYKTLFLFKAKIPHTNNFTKPLAQNAL